MKNDNSRYNGRDGWGYQPLSPDLHTQNPVKPLRMMMNPMSLRAFCGLAWCFFCLGFALGGSL
jgi:hypothetical protein